MYRSDLNPRDRGGAIAAVAAIHAALLFALLNATGRIDITDPQRAIRVFDVTDAPPPPPPEPIRQQERQRERPKETEGAASPKNIRSQATPIVDPQPRIALPLPVPVATTQTPNQGVQPTQGASDVRGPGTGAGGTGTGTGSGGAGSGTGGGGGGIATRAQLLTPSLRSRDYPRELRRRLSRGMAPFVMFTVLPNGRVSNCRIYQSSGDPALDRITCALVTGRFVYRPAYNRRGEPVPSEMAYRQAQ